MSTPRVYVGTYAKYNSGSIAGAWLDIEDYSDKDEFHAACLELHKDESDPELMFQDHEGFPEGMVSESHISEEAFEFAALDADEQEMFTLYRSGVNQEGTLEEAQEAFCGKYSSPADYVQERTEESGLKIPSEVSMYIDWEMMARDWGHDGTTFVRHGGETWVFTDR